MFLVKFDSIIYYLLNIANTANIEYLKNRILIVIKREATTTLETYNSAKKFIKLLQNNREDWSSSVKKIINLDLKKK